MKKRIYLIMILIGLLIAVSSFWLRNLNEKRKTEVVGSDDYKNHQILLDEETAFKKLKRLVEEANGILGEESIELNKDILTERINALTLEIIRQEKTTVVKDSQEKLLYIERCSVGTLVLLLIGVSIIACFSYKIMATP